MTGTPAERPAVGGRPAARPSRARWAIVGMVAVASFLNYVDRQTLALLAQPVQRDLRIDDRGYADLVTAFLAAYTIGNLVTGWLVARLGARRGLALFVGWWSLASAASGLARNGVEMGATRFALGLGETGNWTAAPVLVRQWFPATERGAAIGIYTAAAMLGATVAPPAVTAIGVDLGWRAAFWITGGVGVAWAAIWLIGYRPSAERLVEASPAGGGGGPAAPAAPWRALLARPAIWGLALANMAAAPVWYFYLFWFPKYLTDERGVSLADLGGIAWIPYAAAGVGALLGGWASGRLVARGMAAPRARLAVMAGVALLAPVGAFNAAGPAIAVSLALAAVVGFAHFLWTINITALAVDLFPAADLGKVFGATGLLSGLGGIGTTYLIGNLVVTLSYRPMFVVMALAYPIGFAIVLAAVRRQSADAVGMDA